MKQFLTLALALAAAPAFAHGDEAKDPKQAAEYHQKLAAAHQKAADCLKGGGTVADCNKEAMALCPMMDGHHEGYCPFMEHEHGKHKDEHGMKGKGMKDKKEGMPPETKTTP